MACAVLTLLLSPTGGERYKQTHIFRWFADFTMEKTSGSKEEQMPLNSWSNVIRGLSMNNLANEMTCVGGSYPISDSYNK
jgi:hypothetical protein